MEAQTAPRKEETLAARLGHRNLVLGVRLIASPPALLCPHVPSGAVVRDSGDVPLALEDAPGFGMVGITPSGPACCSQLPSQHLFTPDGQ